MLEITCLRRNRITTYHHSTCSKAHNVVGRGLINRMEGNLTVGELIMEFCILLLRHEKPPDR